jgi:hypothetical protein
MNSIRAFASNNSVMITNLVYIAIFAVILYIVYYYLTAGDEMQITVLEDVMPANQKPNAPLDPLGKVNPLVRINTGGEYTFSFWMYVNGWDYRSGLPKSVLQITDSDLPNHYLLNTILYPNEAKMMIRIHTANTVDTDYTNVSNSNAVISGGTGFNTGGSMTSPVCDVKDIDLQRWINILVVVNGRICDVYYDGKLNRSCVLPDLPEAGSPGSIQTVQIGDKGGFIGQITGIQFFAYALTPDRIYAIYQRGPAGAGSIMQALFQRLGLKITSSGSTPAGNFL